MYEYNEVRKLKKTVIMSCLLPYAILRFGNPNRFIVIRN